MEIGIFGIYSEDGMEMRLGSELVLNGGFVDGSSWILLGNWTIHDGRVFLMSGLVDVSYCRQNFLSVLGGKSYKVILDVYDLVGGGITFVLGGNVFHTLVNGHNEFVMVCGNENTDIVFFPNGSGISCSVDNVSIREVFGDMGARSVGGEVELL